MRSVYQNASKFFLPHTHLSEFRMIFNVSDQLQISIIHSFCASRTIIIKKEALNCFKFFDKPTSNGLLFLFEFFSDFFALLFTHACTQRMQLIKNISRNACLCCRFVLVTNKSLLFLCLNLPYASQLGSLAHSPYPFSVAFLFNALFLLLSIYYSCIGI